MFNDHPHARMVMGLPSKPFVPSRQVEPIPMPPSDGGQAAHRLVSDLIGSPKPTTPKQAFGTLFAELMTRPKDNADLIGMLEGFRLQFVARIRDQRSTARASLEEQHATCYQQCRLTFDQASALRDRLNSADAMINNLDMRLSAARADTMNEEGKRPGPYPRPAELVAWQGDLDRVRAKQAELEAQREAAITAGRKVASALKAALAELAELQGQEENLRARLQGLPGRGPLGILEQVEPASELE